jgi:hypothetical protein
MWIHLKLIESLSWSLPWTLARILVLQIIRFFLSFFLSFFFVFFGGSIEPIDVTSKMVPCRFSLDLPLFGLGPSSKGQRSNLWLSSNRIALFHWTLDLGSSSKVALIVDMDDDVLMLLMIILMMMMMMMMWWKDMIQSVLVEHENLVCFALVDGEEFCW